MFLTKVMLPSLHSPPFTYALLMTPKKFYWAIPGHIFGFLNKNYIVYNRLMWKMSFQWWDSNPGPSQYEPHPISARPGLHNHLFCVCGQRLRTPRHYYFCSCWTLFHCFELSLALYPVWVFLSMGLYDSSQFIILIRSYIIKIN